jgi:hypothetical protein
MEKKQRRTCWVGRLGNELEVFDRGLGHPSSKVQAMRLRSYVDIPNQLVGQTLEETNKQLTAVPPRRLVPQKRQPIPIMHPVIRHDIRIRGPFFRILQVGRRDSDVHLTRERSS